MSVRGWIQAAQLQLREHPEYRNHLVTITCGAILSALIFLHWILSSLHSNNLRSEMQPIEQNKAPANTPNFFIYLFLCILLVMYIIIRACRQSSRNNIPLGNLGNRQVLHAQLNTLARLGITVDILNRFRVSMLRNRDFTADDYEVLQRLDEANINRRGASTEQINRLPVNEVSIDEARIGVEEKRCCAVCLGGYEVGQKTRTVACFHVFHQECIDPWLRTNATCPICKEQAVYG